MVTYAQLTHSQKLVLAIMPKVSGSLSLICSCLIVASILLSPKKRNRVYHRLILGISLCDVSNSIFYGLSTWPIPSVSGYLWATGTENTCILQGFFIQFGISTSIFNGSLAIYYLLFFQYDWRERHFRKYEIFLYGLPILWGVGTAIIGLPLRLFNNANLWCWIAPFPSSCAANPETCIRGANSTWYRWGLYYIPLWAMIILVTYSQVIVISKVKETLRLYKTEDKDESERNSAAKQQTKLTRNEENADDFGEENENPEERPNATYDALKFRKIAERRAREQRSKEIATQCFLYAFSFYFNWFAVTVSNNKSVYESLLEMQQIGL